MSKRAFFLRLTLYILPFAIAFLMLTGFMLYIGESLPLWAVVQMQMGDDPVLYRPRYGNRDIDFKTLSVNMRKPDIVIVGSSRVLQMRGLFFNRDSRAAYNAGAPAWRLEQIETWLAGLNADALPDILIVGIDPVWFHDDYQGDEFPAPVTDFAHIFMANRSVMQTIFAGESLDIQHFLARKEPGAGGLALGLRAIRDGHGFRNDGSEQYGDFLIAHWLWSVNERQRHLDMLRDGQDMYLTGDTISQTRLAQLRDLLDYAAERNITVIGFAPPYMPTLYERLIADGEHTYITQLTPVLSALFDEYEYRYFDFTDVAPFDLTDEDFFDGWHASERVYLRMYRHMLAALPDVLGRYSDDDFLAEADANAPDTFVIFGDAF